MTLPGPARLLASVIHAVASEYRKMDAPPPAAARAFGFGKQAGHG